MSGRNWTVAEAMRAVFAGTPLGPRLLNSPRGRTDRRDARFVVTRLIREEGPRGRIRYVPELMRVNVDNRDTDAIDAHDRNYAIVIEQWDRPRWRPNFSFVNWGLIWRALCTRICGK